MKRTVKGTVYSKEGKRPYTETFQQPFWAIFRWWFYHHIWEKLTGRFYRKLSKYAETRHEKTCNQVDGFCYTGEVRRYPKGRRDGEMVATTESYCAWYPLDIRQDLRCFEFDMTRRTGVSRNNGEFIQQSIDKSLDDAGY